MAVRSTSHAGKQWRRRLKLKLMSLVEGGSYKEFFKGFLLLGTKTGGLPVGVVLDVPPKIHIPWSEYETPPYARTSRRAQFIGHPRIPVELALPANLGVVADASRDMFDPDLKDLGSATEERRAALVARERGEVDLDTRVGTFPEFVIGTGLEENPVRYVAFRSSGGHTGSEYQRTASVFNIASNTLRYWPATDADDLWAHVEVREVLGNPAVEIAISEAEVFASTGYRFLSRGAIANNNTDIRGQFPLSTPITMCDRRVISDGRDIVVIAIPVTASISETTLQNVKLNDYGVGAVYFRRIQVGFTEAGVPAIDTLDDGVIGGGGQTDGPLWTPGWSTSVPLNTSTQKWYGRMPNRMYGDVALTETGGIYWAGTWETSRETRPYIWFYDYGGDDGAYDASVGDFPFESPSYEYFVTIKSIVSISIPLDNPVETITRYHTSVCTNSILDAAYAPRLDPSYDYLLMDDDLTTVRTARNFQCFAPAGQDPFFVAEVINLSRDGMDPNLYTDVNIENGATVTFANVPPPGFLPKATTPASLATNRGTTFQFIDIPDGAFYDPAEKMSFTELLFNLAPRLALVDAKADAPKIGFSIRRMSDSVLKWVELDLATATMTDKGTISPGPLPWISDTSAPSWDVEPTVTCYQRGGVNIKPEPPAGDEIKPAGLVLTYGIAASFSVDPVGYTWLSKDSGQTWWQIAQYAGRTGAFYMGSGFTGFAPDLLYYEINDGATNG